MHPKLPKEIEPFRLAQNGLKLKGELKQKDMARLSESLVDDQGIVDVDLTFDVDAIGTPFMQGELRTDVSLICERCMSPMTVKLSVNCLLAIVVSEVKITSLAEQYDPWLLDNNDPVSLTAVIEDELILALPLVPRHDKACVPSENWSSGEENIVEEQAESPFAILSSLKNKQ